MLGFSFAWFRFKMLMRERLAAVACFLFGHDMRSVPGEKYNDLIQCERCLKCRKIPDEWWSPRRGKS